KGDGSRFRTEKGDGSRFPNPGPCNDVSPLNSWKTTPVPFSAKRLPSPFFRWHSRCGAIRRRLSDYAESLAFPTYERSGLARTADRRRGVDADFAIRCRPCPPPPMAGSRRLQL